MKKLLLFLFVAVAGATQISASELHNAAENGNTTEVLRLLNSGAEIDLPGRLENTPLYMAVANNHPAIVELLIMRGATTINAKNRAHMTPLLKSALHGHTAIAKLLLQNKADVHAVDEIGRNSLILAASSSWHDTTKLLVEHKASINEATHKRVQRCPDGGQQIFAAIDAASSAAASAAPSTAQDNNGI